MGRIIGSLAVLLVVLAAPSEAEAQCARCKDPWWGAEHCVHCSGGNECGESCHFDTAGNCYLPLACGSGGPGLASLAEVLRARGLAVLPEGMGADEAEAIPVQELGDRFLVARNCEGQTERVWRVADGAVRLLPSSGVGDEARAMRRIFHLQAVLE